MSNVFIYLLWFQFSAITAFVDASNVYGSDDESLAALRADDGKGKLKTADNNLLPIDEETDEEFAGDVRAIEMPGLASMHTLFVREHNRLCDLIYEYLGEDDSKGDDYYFENARRILIAEMQNIVYSEYLPVVLGEDAMEGIYGKGKSGNQSAIN